MHTREARVNALQMSATRLLDGLLASFQAAVSVAEDLRLTAESPSAGSAGGPMPCFKACTLEYNEESE